MSKAQVLSMISRLERIADAIPGCSMREVYSLVGQAEGTIHAINSEFERHGIDPAIEQLAGLGYREYDKSSIHEVTRIFHIAAGYYRALAEHL